MLAWIETWLLDFKVLPQENEDESSGFDLIPAIINNMSILLIILALPMLLNY